jgi:hypothetical protein
MLRATGHKNISLKQTAEAVNKARFFVQLCITINMGGIFSQCCSGWCHVNPQWVAIFRASVLYWQCHGNAFLRTKYDLYLSWKMKRKSRLS